MNKRIKKKKEKQRMVAIQELREAIKKITESFVFCFGDELYQATENYTNALAKRIISQLFTEEKE